MIFQLFTSNSLPFLLVCIYIIPFNSVKSSESGVVSKAEIQSCSGCRLNSLHDVKAFIFQDVPNYGNVVFKHVQGALPELVLYTETYQEVDRIPLKDLSRKDCNDLLKAKGFSLKTADDGKQEL